MKRKNPRYGKHARYMAWRIFKYFVSNEHLLSDEKNRALFDMAKKISIAVYCSEHKNAGNKDVENALLLVAKWENKAHPDNFEINEEAEKILLKSE